MKDYLLSVPWLKFIPILLPTCIMLWEIRRDKRKKGWFYRHGLLIVSAISTIVACWISTHDNRESSSWKEEAKKWQADSSSQMNRIESKLGDEGATQKYLEAVRKLTWQLTNEKTGPAVDRFFSSQDERVRLRAEVDKTNQRLLLSYQTKLEPVKSFVEGKFDAWVEACRRKGIALTVESEATAAVMLGAGQVMKVLRKVSFPKGHRIQLQLYPAVIEDGRLAHGVHFQMPFQNPAGIMGDLWTLNIDDTGYAVPNSRSSKFSFKSYSGNLANPIEDEKLTDTVSASLDEVMGYIIDEATVDTK